MSSSKRNFIYQSIYQLLLIILPFVTAPYVSRVLGANGVGTYSFSTSVVHYFSIVVLLGINTYGNREISRVRDNEEKLSSVFSELCFLKFAIGIAILIIYYIYVGCFVKENRLIFSIQSLCIISSMFDINWFFFGLEKFKITVIRNILIKIVTVILIFVFVKSKSDVWIYTIIMCLETFVSQVVLWGYAKKYFKWFVPQKTLLIHLKHMSILFIPSVAMSIYKQMDKIMLGVMTTYTEVGLYEYSEKIINAPLGLISALGIVMLPRMTSVFHKGNFEQAKKYINKSFSFILFLSLACAAGVIGISKDFVPLFFGAEFMGCISVTCVLSLSFPIVAFANVIRTQYLLPRNMDKVFVSSIVIGAITNLIINILLIPQYGADGAAIATLLTELIVCLVQVYTASKDINILLVFKKNLWFLISSIIMLFIVIFVSNSFSNNYVALILEIITGIVIYLLLNVKYCVKLLKVKKVGGNQNVK